MACDAEPDMERVKLAPDAGGHTDDVILVTTKSLEPQSVKGTLTWSTAHQKHQRTLVSVLPMNATDENKWDSERGYLP